ncbi:hypothetical protein [Pleomorphomonas sp. PLEO]|uniref:hypothetical protein n=1 Tax=Pleomorphomonas sp. PLEO TaxID=3239306 RepID=UPI00351E91B3
MTGFFSSPTPTAVETPKAGQRYYAVHFIVGETVRIDGCEGTPGVVTCVSISFGISYEVSWWNGHQEQRAWFSVDRLVPA